MMVALSPVKQWGPVALVFAEKGYEFDGLSMRYRDKETGRYISQKTLIRLRDEVANLSESQLRAIGVNAPNMSPAAVRAALTSATQNAVTVNYLMGAGGINAMSEEQWREIGSLNSGAKDAIDEAVWMDRAGDYSEAQRANFAGLNSGQSVSAFSHAQAAALGVDLPAHPAVGTICGGNCRCSWSITVRVKGRKGNKRRVIEATWNASDDDRVCETCLQRASDYDPWTTEIPLE